MDTNFYIDELYDVTHVCELCAADEKYKELAKFWYYQWVEDIRIAKMAQVPVEDVDKHALAYGWDIQRSDNTEGFYKAVIRKIAPIAMAEGTKAIPGKVLVNCARQLDNIYGRGRADSDTKAKSANDLERTVTFLNGKMLRLIKQGNHSPELVLETFQGIIPEGLLKYLTRSPEGIPVIKLPDTT